ncbi:hypothetical protein [Myxococcus sp. CA040A]|uniref:Lipoprotein n=1 Tax=Myxococcus llanfairpwllgwyngyllgogerychwyrndrobwllllantysiliogogogochensis TaxID=2590453 RepID=A0A540WL72_9BACT|nr:hypothetical protein [Myxococcus sp. CA040A]NTX05304.1 hypothetical protein [Myxococcus sp. CA040A]TQF09577.1 hypothetical protein FJV41_43875 [Myxococcus llanfairpwllgwyngyllgogerychwyrndrobwllllantysiliogogogochensis]
MNLRLGWMWSGVIAVALGLAACNAGDVSGEETGSLETSEAALCSVEQTCPSGTPVTCSSPTTGCTSGPDNGGWVECDGVRTYCPPACTCGTTRYTATRSGEGATCGAAATQARSLLTSTVAARCPAGGCAISDSLGTCVPLGPNRTDGFRMSITRTYSCKEPANCQ